MKRSEARVTLESPKRLRELTADLKRLEAKLRRGGGTDKIERQHKQGKLTARERIELLLTSNRMHRRSACWLLTINTTEQLRQPAL